MSAIELIDAEVRNVVRRQGLDPVTDRAGVQKIINDVLAEYDERSLTRSLPPLNDYATTAKQVLDAVAGFGPLQRYFDDPEVEEIWVNEPSRVFIAKRGRSELTTTILRAAELRDLVERMLKSSGRRIDLSSPFVDATLPDGSRLHVVIPDITPEHWAVNIRKFVVRASSLDELVDLGTLTRHAAAFLNACVSAGLNLVVAGGTQAGKTTLLNCLLNAVPARERIITCEEVFELKILVPDLVRMQTRQPNLEGTGKITLRDLVREALRMRPQRIVVGEVRQAESLDLLIALNSGMPGMSSIHANSAREAITKLCTLPLLAGENIGSRFVVPTVAASVDLVIHIATEADGVRRVREIVGVPGRAEGDLIELEPVFTDRGAGLERDRGFPPHPERFTRAGIDLGTLLGATRGVP
jgi:pilus assembly protein CpaF